MKYGILVLNENSGMDNIGDWVQVFAVQYLYKYMNIELAEVIPIKISELSTYNGETVVLPINYPFWGLYNLSRKIIPVFLGISLLNKKVVKGLRMQEYQPIGCRDYHSLREVQKAGLEAYYGGCLSIALPRRKTEPSHQKIFIADVSERIMDFIPKEIKDKAEVVKHVFFDKEYIDREHRAREAYKRYEEEAGLVITSKIHCAQPCLAMGIPVIFLCETISNRYDVIRQYIPVYTLDNIDTVDWNPKVVELEEHKKRMLENAADRMLTTYNKYVKLCEVNDFFLQGEPLEYKLDSVWAFQNYIKERWNADDCFSYAVWGVSQMAEAIYEWVEENYPNASCVAVIDRSVREEFHGIIPIRIEEYSCCDVPVFVTGTSVNAVAKRTFEERGIEKHVICFNGYYVVDGEEREY